MCGVPTAPAFDPNGQVPGAQAVDLNVPAPAVLNGLAIGRIDPAPDDLSGPTYDPNVRAPVGRSVLLAVQNDPAQPIVQEIFSARKRRGRDLKDGRNKGRARGKERGHGSTPDRRRARGHNTAPVLSKVHDRSSGRVLSRAVDRTTGAEASSALDRNEVERRNKVRRLCRAQTDFYIGAAAASGRDADAQRRCLVGLGLANVLGIFTAIATHPICLLAFIHKIAMAVTFSELRPAFCAYATFRFVVLCGLHGNFQGEQS